jgi:hypothetical protein
VERVPPGELTLEQLDALVAEGRIGLDRYWQLREHVERRIEHDAADRTYDLPPPPSDREAAGGPGFVPPPPRRPGAPVPSSPPPPLVPPPPPAWGPPGWVRLPIAGPSAEAAETRADDTVRRRRRRRPRRTD